MNLNNLMEYFTYIGSFHLIAWIMYIYFESTCAPTRLLSLHFTFLFFLGYWVYWVY
jgi:hypothetical protein